MTRLRSVDLLVLWIAISNFLSFPKTKSFLTAPNQAFVEALSFRHSRFFHPIDKIFGHFNKHSSISLGWLDMGVFMKFVKRGDDKPRNSIQTLDKIHASFKGLPVVSETCRGLALSLDFGGDSRRNLVKH